ncbi:thrombospondin type 3 repeat-containing protein [Salinimicrobium xinjiangense]|uniref:thrombospondin type 3 repeat-containing protein n=1 Tax=Salinimicrobium xinjiangense TaxID=438596 RepID=UPI0004226D20|nr:thrombospondin type 3 repeat-containing protein [Salinimicrobium xinjiangense]
MRKFKIYLSFLAVFALLFTSCSKEENSGMNDDSGKATLSFGAIVQDLAANSNNKQSDVGDFPECSADAPAYVEIVLMQEGNAVVGSLADPYRVDLVAGQIFTEEDAALELEPGNYSLDHFSVYNAEGDLIWLAPKGGIFADFVDNPLPLNIDLGAGVKKYVDVSVVCYDDRDVNQYGYLFFELDANEAFEFCFFANYCTPEGRHYPARYAVDISIDGTSLYSGVVNNTGRDDNGDLFADPLCFALPNLDAYADDEEYIDYTLTLLDWTENEDAYGDVDQMVITGSLSRAEIMANFDGADNVEYEHVRFGCDDDGGNGGVVDSDEDGVPDSVDECPTVPGSAENNGCPETGETDADGDGVVDTIDECPNTPDGVAVDAVGCPIDTDEDGVPDYVDNCPTEAGPVDNNGCPTSTECPEVCSIPQTIDDLEENCYFVYPDTTDPDGFFAISEAESTIILENTLQEEFGTVTLQGTLEGQYILSLDGIINTDRVIAYEIEVKDDLGDECSQSFCDADVTVQLVDDDQSPILINLDNSLIDDSTIYIRVKAIICETPVGTPE